MDITKVNEELIRIFSTIKEAYENRRVVFWYDEEKDYEESIDNLDLPKVEILKLDENNSFEIKYTVEYEKKKTDFLIYAPIKKPVDSENWLLGIESYAYQFSVDPIDLLLKEFGLEKDMKQPFTEYKVFFNNNVRKNKLLSFDAKYTNLKRLSIGIISALAKTRTVNFEQAIRNIFSQGLDEDDNRYFVEINKYGNEKRFWQLVTEHFGYTDEKPSLEKFLYYLVINYIASNLKTALPTNWEEYNTGNTNSIVFINQWINHKQDSESFVKLVPKVDNALNLKKHLGNWEIQSILECEYSQKFDIKIIEQLAENLVHDYDQFDKLQKLIEVRKNKLYYNKFENHYQVLNFAIKLLNLKKQIGRITLKSAKELYIKYVKEYFKFDQAYRKYSTYYEQIRTKDIFIDLNEKIEKLYTNWFLEELGNIWSQAVTEELEENWFIDNITPQTRFYKKYIKEFVDSNDRVYVIISDALRYEVADELKTMLSVEIDGITSLENMQGIIPSNTQFGMAALMPHKTLTYTENVLLDGESTQGSTNRLKILENYAESFVVKADNIIEMSQADMRDTFKGKKLVYIYHNKIDASGDHAATEKKVFSECENALEDLDLIVRKLKNNITATNIFITSDHGFLYRRTPLVESDKTKNIIEEASLKRRYGFGETDQNVLGVHQIKLPYLNQTLIVPKGCNVFSVRGPGMNFVHGGVQLQEVVIPVIAIRRKRNDDKYRSSKVDVELIGSSRKITNKIFRVQLFQMERISETVLPRKLNVYFINENSEPISDIKEYVANKEDDNRSKKLKFTLKDKIYKENEKCYLILEDTEESVEKEYKRFEFEISLLIADDFGFNFGGSSW